MLTIVRSRRAAAAAVFALFLVDKLDNLWLIVSIQFNCNDFFLFLLSSLYVPARR